LQKGAYIQNGIVFSLSDYKQLSIAGKPIKIICLNNENLNYLNSKNKEYLLIGEKNNIPNRYKCKIREHWQIIPNISDPSEGFFFKRSHLFPKMVKNEANVLVTDSAYDIKMKNNYDINSFIFSFYNSLTLVFSELGGRYYGGGVLELTPREFKELPMPYLNITNTDFECLTHRFKKSKDIKKILDYTDFILLSKIGLNREKILKVQYLRDKLSQKRRGISVDKKS
jgi:adenine-specific DNA-methyltransferase